MWMSWYTHDRVDATYFTCDIYLLTAHAGTSDGFSIAPTSDAHRYKPVFEWGFHIRCYEYVGSVSTRLIAATKSDFSPVREVLADAQAALHMVRQTLDKKLERLPRELRWQIADQVMPYYLTAAAYELRIEEPHDVQVDLALDIWASLVKVHGTTYISGLSNAREDLDRRRAVLLHKASTHPPADAIYVAVDQWGVRRVAFGRADEPFSAEKQPDIWWECIHIYQNGVNVFGHSDVSIYQVLMSTADLNVLDRVLSSVASRWAASKLSAGLYAPYRSPRSRLSKSCGPSNQKAG